MKKINLFSGLLMLSLIATSCQSNEDKIESVVDFEDVTLNSNGYWSGSLAANSFKSGKVKFYNTYSEYQYGGITYSNWEGFGCSQKTDTVTPGWDNQYSTIAGSGALKSKQFGLIYGSGALVCPANGNGVYSLKSIMVTNSTYAYLDMKNGSSFSKKFVANDWFKLTIKGYFNKTVTDSAEVYLADFRNGKSDLLKTWKTVDLSKLGKVDSVAFSFRSTDNGSLGMNTPAYVCVDNITLTQSISK